MNETINTHFDPSTDLPEWARGDKTLVWLCKRDLTFRCAVGAAEMAQRKFDLRQEARRRYDEYCNS